MLKVLRCTLLEIYAFHSVFGLLASDHDSIFHDFLHMLDVFFCYGLVFYPSEDLGKTALHFPAWKHEMHTTQNCALQPACVFLRISEQLCCCNLFAGMSGGVFPRNLTLKALAIVYVRL